MIYFDTFTIGEIFAFSNLNAKRMFEPMFAEASAVRPSRSDTVRVRKNGF